MSRNKKQKEETIIPPAALAPVVSCATCPFYKKVDDHYGKCIRRLANYVNSENLTAHGPLGNFYIMTPDSVCGEHPKFSASLS